MLPAVFLATVADVRREGHSIRIRRLWTSTDVPQTEIVEVREALLGCGFRVLRLRRFVPPWGRIYFRSDWSHLEDVGQRVEQPAETDSARDLVLMLAAGVLGFATTRKISREMYHFGIDSFPACIAALGVIVVLCIVSATFRRYKPTLAVATLAAAGIILGLVRW
jgi:hypothetical protein